MVGGCPVAGSSLVHVWGACQGVWWVGMLLDATIDGSGFAALQQQEWG
jgi:hypothetical protein